MNDVVEFWEIRRKPLLNDFSRAAYLMSPVPEILAHSTNPENKDPEDFRAVDRLISKIFGDYSLTGEARDHHTAGLIHEFHSEYRKFKNKQGDFQSKNIWIMASNPRVLAHEWHESYSVPYTNVFGKLACRVTSKILGIGSAERDWKIVKRIKKGHRSNTGTEGEEADNHCRIVLCQNIPAS